MVGVEIAGLAGAAVVVMRASAAGIDAFCSFAAFLGLLEEVAVVGAAVGAAAVAASSVFDFFEVEAAAARLDCLEVMTVAGAAWNNSWSLSSFATGA